MQPKSAEKLSKPEPKPEPRISDIGLDALGQVPVISKPSLANGSIEIADDAEARESYLAIEQQWEEVFRRLADS